jgi:molybdopterin-guanine dinucleotide biosynthesis protein A
MTLGVILAGGMARHFESGKTVVMLNGRTVFSHAIGARAVDIFDEPASMKAVTPVTAAEERHGL